METKNIALKLLYTLLLCAVSAGMIFTILKNKRGPKEEELSPNFLDDQFKAFCASNKIPDNLELCKIVSLERYAKEYKFIQKNKPSSTSVFEASADVSFPYSIKVSDDWSFLQVNDVLRLVAPPLSCTSPSYDASNLNFKVRGASNAFGEAGKLDDFKKDLASSLLLRSESGNLLDLALEKSRSSLASKIAQWLVPKSGRVSSIRAVLIKFRNEEKFPKFPLLLDTTKLKTPNEQ